MDKYLLELLKTVNTIIIPGLGALTIVNHDTGEIMFMSYLKHDDGKLSSYIAENEGWDETEAKNLIAKYVRGVITNIDQGESYDMFQFGSFFKDEDGEIDFKNWDKNTSKTEEIAEPVIETEPEVIETPNVSIPESEKIEPTIIEEKIAIEPKEEKIKLEVPSVEAIKTAMPTPPVDTTPENTYVESTKQKNILEQEEMNKTQEKLNKLKEKKAEKPQKKRKGAGFYILLALLCIICTGGIYVGMNFQEIKQHIPFLAENKDKTEKKEKSAIDEMKEIMGETEQTEDVEAETPETTVESEIIPEEVDVETEIKEISKPINRTSTSNDSHLPFHIIVGAFSSSSNANKLGEKLRAQGYNPKVGLARGMNLVSVKSYATKQEAQNAISTLSEVAPKGWVFEWPD